MARIAQYAKVAKLTLSKRSLIGVAVTCSYLVWLALPTASHGLVAEGKAASSNPPKAAVQRTSLRGSKHTATSDKQAVKPGESAYDFSLPKADGGNIPLSNYKSKYILIVNLARKSSYNDQLPALMKLGDMYKSRGLVVIGVPSNDFGASEPGTDAEIQKAYADAKVNFLITGECKLTGNQELPFYLYLTKSKDTHIDGPVHWNYTKFIINNKGDVVARFEPDVAPDSPQLLATIDQILDGSYKSKKKGSDGADSSGDDDDDE